MSRSPLLSGFIAKAAATGSEPFFSLRPPLLTHPQAALISMFPSWASAVIALRCGPPNALREVLAKAASTRAGLPPGAWRGKSPADMAAVFAVVIAHTHETGWQPGSAAAAVRTVCGQAHPFTRLIYVDDSSPGRAAAAEAAAELQRHTCCANRGTVLWAATPLGRVGAQRAGARLAEDGETILFLDPGAGAAAAAGAGGSRGPRILADEQGLFRLSEAFYSACQHWNMTSDEAAGLLGGGTLPLVAVGEMIPGPPPPAAAVEGGLKEAARVGVAVSILEAAGGGSRGFRGLPLDDVRWAAASAEVVRAVPDAALMDWECRWLPDVWAEVAWSFALAERAGGRVIGTQGLRLLAGGGAAGGGEAGSGVNLELEEGEDDSDDAAQPERAPPSASIDSDSDARGEDGQRASARRRLATMGGNGARQLLTMDRINDPVEERLEAWVRGEERAWRSGAADDGGGGGAGNDNGRVQWSIRHNIARLACLAPPAALEVLHGPQLPA